MLLNGKSKLAKKVLEKRSAGDSVTKSEERHACMHTWTHMHILTRVSTSMHADVHVHTHIHMQLLCALCIHTSCTCIDIHVCVYTYTNALLCLLTHSHMYTYMHILTHIYIYNEHIYIHATRLPGELTRGLEAGRLSS